MRLLLVDDEANFAEACAAYLADAGYQVEVARDAAEGRERLAAGSYDGVLLDLRLPGEDGLALLSHIRERWPALPVLVVTACDEAAGQALSLGVQGVVIKPAEMRQLQELLAAALLPASRD